MSGGVLPPARAVAGLRRRIEAAAELVDDEDNAFLRVCPELGTYQGLLRLSYACIVPGVLLLLQVALPSDNPGPDRGPADGASLPIWSPLLER